MQRRIGDIWGVGRVLGYLAKVVLRSGEYDRAEALCHEALGLSSHIGDKWGIGLAEAGLGGVAWSRGELKAAATMLKHSLLTFRDVGARDRVAECLQDLASLSRQFGAAEQSVRLSASAEAAQQRGRLALWPAVQARRDEEMATLRAFLDHTAFEQQWSRGLGASIDDAVEDALTVPHCLSAVDCGADQHRKSL